MKIKKVVFLIIPLVMIAVLGTGCKKSGTLSKEEYKLEDPKLNYEIPLQKLAVVSLLENASTGYSWHYMISDEKVLEFSSDESISTTGDKNIVGAPMIHNWKFKAVAPGTTNIKFAYCREWEAKALESKMDAFAAKWQVSIETRDYTVTVK